MQAQGAFNPLTDDRRVQLLNARLRLDPQDIAARLDLAAIYERYRLSEEAFDHYSRAMNISPSEAAAVGLARTARATGQAAEVAPVLAAFLRRSPEAAEAWNELGMLQDERGDRAAAENAFRQAIAARPHSDRLHNNLGYNLLLQNVLEGAEAQFRHALHLNANFAAARNNLGIALARRGDVEGARREFLAAGDPASAHNNLAVVLMEMGEYERARAELVKSLQARNYFAAAIENFKIVTEALRGARSPGDGSAALPLSSLRGPSALIPSPPMMKVAGKSEEPENRP